MQTLNQYKLYHPNGKGNGSALSLELHPAGNPDVGKVILSIVPQKTVGSRADGTPTFPTFAWADAFIVRLEVTEIEKMLEVFAGETESINDGKGLLDARNGTTFCVRHTIDPVPRYIIEIVKREGEEPKKRLISLTPTEAGALYHGLAACMGSLMFG